jgi:hypothetical protein
VIDWTRPLRWPSPVRTDSPVEREARPFVAFAGQVVASLVVFMLLERLLVGLGRLPPDAYEHAFFTPEIVARSVRHLRARVPLVVLAAGLAALTLALVAIARSAGRIRVLGIFAGWKELDDGVALRWLVGAATGIAVWTLAAYPYNAYFDRFHLADRLILVALWVALLWRPVFTLPFAVVASAIAHQFQIPLASYSWTETELLVRIPIMLGAFWIVRSLVRDRRADTFVFLFCCLIAVTWWASGWGKVRMGWITHPHIDFLLVGAYANGWLAFMDAGTITRMADVVAGLRFPLMVGTLVVECGALFLLWRRWSLPLFLCLTSTLHLGAFALTGIFFWKWILIDVAFLLFLFHGRRLTRLGIFSPAHFVFAVVIILANGVWISARNLSWFDTPLSYVIRLEGVDADGGAHVLPAGFFRPYSETFVLETFPYLSPYAQLTGPMGVTQSRETADALLAAATPEDIFALERTRARTRYDPARSARFDAFVTHWLRASNRDGAREALLRISAPRHLWTFPLDTDRDAIGHIVEVRVVEITNFYDGETLREIRRRTLRTIDLRSGPVVLDGS